MQKGASIFLYFILLLVVFFSPVNLYAQKDTVFVSATVLEHITFIKKNNFFDVRTNLGNGYWEIEYGSSKVFVARF